MIDFCIGTVVFSLLGYTLMMGEDTLFGLIGLPNIDLFTNFKEFIASPADGFTYYPGNGYSKRTTANTQKIYVDLNEYNVQAYNINGNNYFKIRDIAKMMEGTSKIFDIEYDAGTNSINMIGYFDYT